MPDLVFRMMIRNWSAHTTSAIVASCPTRREIPNGHAETKTPQANDLRGLDVGDVGIETHPSQTLQPQWFRMRKHIPVPHRCLSYRQERPSSHNLVHHQRVFLSHHQGA